MSIAPSEVSPRTTPFDLESPYATEMRHENLPVIPGGLSVKIADRAFHLLAVMDRAHNRLPRSSKIRGFEIVAPIRQDIRQKYSAKTQQNIIKRGKVVDDTVKADYREAWGVPGYEAIPNIDPAAANFYSGQSRDKFIATYVVASDEERDAYRKRLETQLEVFSPEKEMLWNEKNHSEAPIIKR